MCSRNGVIGRFAGTGGSAGLFPFSMFRAVRPARRGPPSWRAGSPTDKMSEGYLRELSQAPGGPFRGRDEAPQAANHSNSPTPPFRRGFF